MLALIAAVTISQAEAELPDANSYVHSLLAKQRAREEAVSRYTYDVHEVEERLDDRGGVRERHTRGYQVFYVDGRPVLRQVAENGRPLARRQQQQEDRRVDDARAAIRARSVPADQAELRLSAIIERYEFKTVGHAVCDEGPCLTFDFQPWPGRRALEDDGVLRSLAGRLWVDEDDRELVKAQVHNTRDIAFAFGLGARLTALDFVLEFRRMDDGVWLPHRLQAGVTGRILLLKGFQQRIEQRYDNYRRFGVETQERLTPPPR